MDFDYSRLDPGFAKLSKPAQRALINNSIFRVEDLAKWTRASVAKLHGVGPSAFPILTEALQGAGLSFSD